jgi:F420H(2)-dependent quinone reductase
MDLLQLADRAWPVLRWFASAHAVAYRTTGGLFGHRFPGAPPMLLLDHVGARSGVRRTTPLAYTAEGDDLVVVASKGGHSRHPAWYHNLRAHPETTVRVGREVRPVRARVATPAERERLWPLAVRTYSPYETYQRRAGREIPLVILEPR